MEYAGIGQHRPEQAGIGWNMKNQRKKSKIKKKRHQPKAKIFCFFEKWHALRAVSSSVDYCINKIFIGIYYLDKIM